MVRNIDSQHTEWQRHRWQKMNTEFLQEECSRQLESIEELPEDAHMWDVYMGMTESITNIKVTHHLRYIHVYLKYIKFLKIYKSDFIVPLKLVPHTNFQVH